MRIYTFGQHIAMTPAFRSYIMNKLRRLKKSRVAKSSDIHVRVERDKGQFTVSAFAHLDHQPLHTAARAIDAYTAIDVLAAKLNRLIVKRKEQHMQRRVRETPLALNFR